MATLTRTLVNSTPKPTKILQIGAGNFSRAFIDFAIQVMNDKNLINAGIVIATSSPERLPNLNQQEGLYTVIEGSQEGLTSTLIDSVNQQISIPDSFDLFLDLARDKNINIIISNTTEVGITYKEETYSHQVQSFPARLTIWIEEKYKSLKKDNQLTEEIFVLPCELITNNGSTLREYVLKHAHHWNFDKDCLGWIESNVKFYDTLVDRMVPGYPQKLIQDLEKEWNYQDAFAVFSEKFFFLAIKGDTDRLDAVLPFSKLSLDIIYTKDLEFYYKRKVSFLNGSHTAILGMSMLLGYTTVQESLKNPKILSFLESYLLEAQKSLGQSPETQEFIDNVLLRFTNSYLEHQWKSILLNALPKFVVRNIPVLLIMQENNQDVSKGLFSLACLIVLYRKGVHQDSDYKIFQKIMDDNPDINEFIPALLESKSFFPMTLPVNEWKDIIINHINNIENNIEKSVDNIIIYKKESYNV